MNGFQIFVMRAIIAFVFAVVLARVFYPELHPVHMAGFGGILLGLAYLREYFRNRNTKE